MASGNISRLTNVSQASYLHSQGSTFMVTDMYYFQTATGTYLRVFRTLDYITAMFNFTIDLCRLSKLAVIETFMWQLNLTFFNHPINLRRSTKHKIGARHATLTPILMSFLILTLVFY